MASHEFRSPLTTILTSASLIEKYEKTEDQEKRLKHLNRVKLAVGNLTNILEEFLSVGRLEENKIEKYFSDFDLVGLVNESLEDISTMQKAGQKINYSHVGASHVYSDKSIIRKILINLCSNAIKFSPENSEINIFTETTEKYLEIIVQDSGIGISESDQKHLFDRFFRGANATNIQGTGLGLHIVGRYLVLLNGTIICESQLEKGTTFKVTLRL